MKNNLLVPVIAGAAVTAGLVYLFTTEEGEKLRGQLADGFQEHFPELADQLNGLKDQFLTNPETTA